MKLIICQYVMGFTEVVEVDEGKKCDYLWFTKFCLLC